MDQLSQDEDSDGFEEEKSTLDMLNDADAGSEDDSDYNPSQMDIDSWAYYSYICKYNSYFRIDFSEEEITAEEAIEEEVDELHKKTGAKLIQLKVPSQEMKIPK